MTSPDVALLAHLDTVLADAGLSGSFVVRDLGTGEQVDLRPDVVMPIASLVKIPLGVAVLERLTDGRLDGATPVRVRPGRAVARGPVGTTRFRHESTISVDDLLYLSTSLSDSVAADALFELCPPDEVNEVLRGLGCGDIVVRHLLDELMSTPVERLPATEGHLAHTIAIGATRSGRGHPVAQLDLARANIGTARSLSMLLGAIWSDDDALTDETRTRMQDLLSHNVFRQRLAPDLASDAALWSSKTGTLMNLRHEAGVVEHEDGQVLAVVALTESRVAAVVQASAESVIGHVARTLHDHLRAR